MTKPATQRPAASAKTKDPKRISTNLRPRDAATLILLREAQAPSTNARSHRDPKQRVLDTKVLMGQRTTKDVWSKLYVFPGGTVDSGDHRIPVASELRPEVEERLTLSCTPARAKALAIAAVRETFEETGLMLGGKAEHTKFPPGADPHWEAFQQRGLAPDLVDLHFLCRAITPPFRPKRFNARFFIATADHVEDDLVGSGELHDLQWFSLRQTKKLPLPLITQTVLQVLAQRLLEGSIETPEQTPLFRTIRNRHLRLFE